MGDRKMRAKQYTDSFWGDDNVLGLPVDSHIHQWIH